MWLLLKPETHAGAGRKRRIAPIERMGSNPREIRGQRFCCIAWTTASAILAGVGATTIPAASRAATFSEAVPLPPLMIAPAWPIRFPGGAVRPAMNAATGLVT